MTFSTETIISLGVCGLLTIVIPIVAIIIYKIKNKETWFPSALIGAATFLVFSLILESLLHLVMLPIIGDNTVFYVIYGALAAGVFEETGRFVAYKLLMKKHYTTKNSILMGLGHGGFEAAAIVGVTMISYLAMGLMINSMGLDEVLRQTSSSDPATAELVAAQLETIAGFGFINAVLNIFERLIAMAVHVCFSVWVYKAVTVKGKLWLYPAAIATHAIIDVPAAMYQKGVIGILPVYIAMTVLTAVVVFITIKMVKKSPDKAEGNL
ncbi:MAG: YhfC family intramembrane metalloprotease [Oscillospiraceae bacterium]|nr:YhfC family intramembrane metalloprotease [Oscillospiraceae bacterium]